MPKSLKRKVIKVFYKLNQTCLRFSLNWDALGMWADIP